MVNLRKKNQTETLEPKDHFSQTKNKVEGHSSRVEDRESQSLKIKLNLKRKQKKS
jgi:hypothetical protein